MRVFVWTAVLAIIAYFGFSYFPTQGSAVTSPAAPAAPGKDTEASPASTTPISTVHDDGCAAFRVSPASRSAAESARFQTGAKRSLESIWPIWKNSG